MENLEIITAILEDSQYLVYLATSVSVAALLAVIKLKRLWQQLVESDRKRGTPKNNKK